MASRNTVSPRKALAAVLGFVIFSVMLGALYYVRTPNLEPPVSGQQGTPADLYVDSLALQALEPIGIVEEANPGETETSTDTADPIIEAVTNRPAPGQTQAPEGWDVIDIYIDGWSLASLAEPIEAYDPTHSMRADIAFQPLSPSRLTGVLKSNPEIIEKYAARLISNDKQLACTANGCTANGQPIDMTTLAEPQRAQGIGPLYQTYGIDTGVYVARIAVPDSTPELLLNTTAYTLRIPGPGSQEEVTIEPVPAESNVGTGGENPNEISYGNVALAGGYGVLFPLTPTWIEEDGANFNWQNWPSTIDTAALLGETAGPILASGPGSTENTTLVERSDASLLTYISSPTTGCGVVGVCTPQPAQIEVTDIKNTTTTACYQKPSDNPSGRVALLRQDLTLEVTPPGPIYIPGVGNGDGTATPIDVTSITTTAEPTTFTQTVVYVIDDSGLVTYVSGREITDTSTFSFDKVRDGSFVSCTTS